MVFLRCNTINLFIEWFFEYLVSFFQIEHIFVIPLYRFSHFLSDFSFFIILYFKKKRLDSFVLWCHKILSIVSIIIISHKQKSKKFINTTSGGIYNKNHRLSSVDSHHLHLRHLLFFWGGGNFIPLRFTDLTSRCSLSQKYLPVTLYKKIPYNREFSRLGL